MLVYPAPEPLAPPLPPGEPRSGGASAASAQATGEFDGVRAYRRGDPLKLVVWKKLAKAGRTGQPRHPARPALGALARLRPDRPARNRSPVAQALRLGAAADRLGVDYGLRLPGLEIRPSCGAAHRLACLEALALC